jgi:hypothetical protein
VRSCSISNGMQNSKLQFSAKGGSAFGGKIQKCLKFLLLTYTFAFCILPFDFVFASSVYIDTSHSEFFEGDTILFHVRIDSEGKNINTVEGEVLLDNEAGSVFLTDINISGSLFSLWPGKPLPSENNASVSFVGGSPGGFVSRDAIIFNIILKLQKAGQITLAPNNFSVYLNDGKGTKDDVRVKNLVIDVVPKKPDSRSRDDWNNLISNDTTPPEPFEIYLGQENSVFDGKKFLSFSATDAQSGIAYYEIIEGNRPPVRGSDTYILQEQNKPVKVTIIAYDSAGNARESTYATPDTVSYPIIILIAVIFIILIFVFVMYKKRSFLQNTTV